MLVSSVFQALSAVSLFGLTGAALEAELQRPIYAIAHRVLHADSVPAALLHGANAIEIDLTAWYLDWYADHDGKWGNTGSTAREMFEAIATERRGGQDISFVWLDIKNPDYCAAGRACSIEGLQAMVRDILEPVGIRALYGFYQTETSRGFGVIRDTLNKNEAICLSGVANEVLALYDTNAVGLPANQRIMDDGAVELWDGFGDCQENGICAELRQGGEARNEGKLGKVMGWTSARGDTLHVDKMLGPAGVDGIIYGFQMADYADDVGPRAAARDILNFVHAHPDTHRMATKDDAPW